MTTAVPARPMDPESRSWVLGLASTGPERDAAVVRLHGLLLRLTTAEVRRRSARFRLFGPEVDDLAHQAAADATLAVCARIGSFRGESRFTTWACTFAIFEVSSKLGRHFWRNAGPDQPDWDALPARSGEGPVAAAENVELLDALRQGIEQVLTDRQRRIFVALALNAIPLDAVVAQYDTNRNAVYKTMFDARRKLRAHLVAGGFLDREQRPGSGPTNAPVRVRIPGGSLDLAQFLSTDPRDVGCDRALQVLHLYAELISTGAGAAERYPGVAAHFRACGPCGDDYQALLGVIGAD